jgi:hypothetical protein
VIRDWTAGAQTEGTLEVPCVRCGALTPAAEVDRLLWCAPCVAAAKGQAARIGWSFGGGLAAVLALYIHFGIQPDYSLIPAGWAATLAVAFYLGGRVARELAFGLLRFRNQAGPRSAPSDAGS